MRQSDTERCSDRHFTCRPRCQSSAGKAIRSQPLRCKKRQIRAGSDKEDSTNTLTSGRKHAQAPFDGNDVAIRDECLRENFAWLNRLTLSLLKQHPEKDSVATKRRACGWNDDYMLQVLTGTSR